MFRFATATRLLLAAMLIVLSQVALAQQAPMVGIDPVRASLDRIEQAAKRGSLGVRELYDLSQSIVPLREELRAKIADLEPRLADLDARLKGLGPAPAHGAPAEDATIAAERARLTQQRAEIDAAIKQAQLLDTRADQLAAALSERRRLIYAESLFQRSPNLLDPFFWRDVVAALPDQANRIVNFAQEWGSYARDKGGYARMGAAGLAVAGLLIFVIGLTRWWQRGGWVTRLHARYGKALAALLVFARHAIPMPVMLFAVFEILAQFDLVPPEGQRILFGLVIGVAIAAASRGAPMSVLAPSEPARRLMAYDDGTAHSLAGHLIWAGRLLGIAVVLRALHRSIGTSNVLDEAVRMLFAVSIVALLVHLLFERREDADGSAERHEIPGVRLLAWIVIVCILGALLSGYAGFAAFIAGRVVFTLTLIAILYLLLIVTDAVINQTLSADSHGGRVLARQLGIDPRRLTLLGKIASGIVRAVFVLVILAFAVGRWEVAASDLFDAIKGMALGVRIGDFTISLGAVLGAILLFLIVVGITRFVQRWLERDVMPHTSLESSLQLSIVTVFGYVGFIIALIVGLSEIGIDPQKIALVAGALSVGIGFGLQSIVSNFVSGLILLAERPIRVGDQIVVKNEEGFVRRISVRATEIETFDKASVIVPNSELITGVVKNWTHANTLGRINIKLNVGYDADPEQVIEILKRCLDEHPSVLKQPAPAVLLSEFGSALTFEIFCIVTNLGDRGGIKSELQIAILRRLRAAGIALSPPQDVRLVRAPLPEAKSG